ncbi:MAG: ABC transporter permease [Hyphomicrobiales bacterium]|nr:MAG: ABC transporter permease [Hyphomicrobiales bacterium]
MAICGAIPMAIVAFYSVHDTFGGNVFFWVGPMWFKQVLTSPDFFLALLRSLGFSLLVLAIEIPLGIYIALRLPAKGALSSIYIVLMAIPLLTPSMVVGYVWKVLVLPQAGLLGAGAAWLGFDYDMNSTLVTWLTLAMMDTWHWTSLVVLLCFAGLRAIPHDYYQAAQIDGASGWAVFRYVQLPKLRLVLLIAGLLRFIDSFMLYTEAYVVTRGGPGVSTTFLSHELIQTATIQFDLGEGGAMSVIYFLIVLCVSWVFFSLIVPRSKPGTVERARA